MVLSDGARNSSEPEQAVKSVIPRSKEETSKINFEFIIVLLYMFEVNFCTDEKIEVYCKI